MHPERVCHHTHRHGQPVHKQYPGIFARMLYSVCTKPYSIWVAVLMIPTIVLEPTNFEFGLIELLF